MYSQMLIYLCLFVKLGLTARILGFFPVPSVSHQVIFQAIWKELALRGHDVTVISPNIIKDETITNLKEIDVGHLYNLFKTLHPSKIIPKNASELTRALTFHKFLRDLTELSLNDENVQHLLNSEAKFDLCIVQALHPLMLSLGAKYKVPVIGISSYGVLLNMHDAVGNPTHPVITPDLLLSYDNEMNFWIKVNSFLYNIWYRMLYYCYELPKSDKIARKYFGDDMPYLGDLVNNVSLILVNVNPILNPVRANVPNIIEINQVHIKKAQPLPKDIKDYLDSSPQGVVYFSLGSNIKSSMLPDETRREILAALTELPYNVLWKWEADHLPGKPKNVYTRKWLPQQDVLGHPNIKVFITQGGLQSAEETILKGIPVIGIPFIADQPQNVAALVGRGLGLKVDFDSLTKDVLKNAILEVAGNKKYKEAVLKAKKILEDQPLKSVDKAVWWIEYVIRHGDVSHLRSPAANMSFFEYFMIDVILFLLFIIFTFCYVTAKVFKVKNFFVFKFSNKLKSN